MRPRALTWLVAALILGPGKSRAAEPPRGQEAALKSAAGALLEEGNRLYEAGQYEAALSRYEAAYATFASPKIFLNLGKANQKLGRLPQAEGLLQRFLREGGVDPGSAARRDAEERLASIREGLGSVVVESDVLGAEIFVDGKAEGVVPREPIRALAGAHEVAVQKAGYFTYREAITVRAAGSLTVRATLAPLVVDARPEEAVRVTPAAAAAVEPEGGVWSRWWFWGGIAVIAAGAIGAGVALASGGGDYVPESELGVTPTDRWRSL